MVEKDFNPTSFLAIQGRGRRILKYSKKEILFTQGEHANAVFYVTNGKVKVTVLSTDGKEAIVALLGPDEFAGEGCLVGQPKRLATASAMSDCEVMRLEKNEIQRVLRDHLAFSEMFL